MKRIVCSAMIIFFLSFSFLPVLAADTNQLSDNSVSASDGGGLFSWIGDIAGFIKRLVVPDEDYFHDELADLSTHVNDRFGGLAYLYHMLDHFFTELKSVPNVSLAFSLPNNFFFRGYHGFSVDLFTAAKPYLNLIRSVLTGAFGLFAAITCYHKLRLFFSES